MREKEGGDESWVVENGVNAPAPSNSRICVIDYSYSDYIAQYKCLFILRPLHRPASFVCQHLQGHGMPARLEP